MPMMMMARTLQNMTLSSSQAEVSSWSYMYQSKRSSAICLIFAIYLRNLRRSFYGGIIGFKGNTKRRIESDTDTEIYIPRQNENSNVVSIKSKTRSNVCAALRKIRALLKSLRKRMKPTHFLAVPFNNGVVQQKFIELRVMQSVFSSSTSPSNLCPFLIHRN